MKTPLSLWISLAAVLLIAVATPMVIAATATVSAGEAFKQERMALRLQQSQDESAVSAPQSLTVPTGIDYKAARIKLAAQREKDQALTATAVRNARNNCPRQFPNNAPAAGRCLRDAVKAGYQKRATHLRTARTACLKQATSVTAADNVALQSCIQELYLKIK